MKWLRKIIETGLNGLFKISGDQPKYLWITTNWTWLAVQTLLFLAGFATIAAQASVIIANQRTIIERIKNLDEHENAMFKYMQQHDIYDQRQQDQIDTLQKLHMDGGKASGKKGNIGKDRKVD